MNIAPTRNPRFPRSKIARSRRTAIAIASGLLWGATAIAAGAEPAPARPLPTAESQELPALPPPNPDRFEPPRLPPVEPLPPFEVQTPPSRDREPFAWPEPPPSLPELPQLPPGQPLPFEPPERQLPPEPEPLRFPAPSQVQQDWSNFSRYLFNPLWLEFPRGNRLPEAVVAADRTLRDLWDRARQLDLEAADYADRSAALLRALVPPERQYRTAGDRWGRLKIAEFALALHYARCEDDRALELARSATELAEASGSEKAQADWLRVLARLLWASGVRAASPEENREGALQIEQRRLDATRTPAGQLTHDASWDAVEVGNLYRALGRHEAAIARYEEAVAAARTAPMNRDLDVYFASGRTFELGAIDALVSLHESLGNVAEVDRWTQARSRAQDFYQRIEDARALAWGASLEEGVRDLPPAVRKPRLEEALQTFRDLGYPWEESDALADLSQVELELGNYRAAIAAGEAARDLQYRLNDGRGSPIDTLATAYRAIGQPDRAAALEREAETFLAEQAARRQARPRFFYHFLSSLPIQSLPDLHRDRPCAARFSRRDAISFEDAARTRTPSPSP